MTPNPITNVPAITRLPSENIFGQHFPLRLPGRFISLLVPGLSMEFTMNLSNPALATAYAQVHFTTNTGQTFHGKPTSFSATVLNNASNPRAALHFVEYLLSPAGQQHIQAAHFLPSPALVGGDARAVPRRLRPFLQGEYEYPG